MNFRSCKYFLTVFETGSINAAARRLYISEQSLSEHMRKLEKELNTQLFHRDKPLTLTESGRIFYRTASEIMASLDRMDADLAAVRGTKPNSLVIGFTDYGTPDFIPALVNLFLKRTKNVLLQTKEILPGEEISPDIPLLISARELRGYRCENLFSDRPVILIRDSLLRQCFGKDWRARKQRLEAGDLSAIKECPFIRIRNTPLDRLADLVFEKNDFHPPILPVDGSTQALTDLCWSGQGALISFLNSVTDPGAERGPTVYAIPNVPESVPCCFICYLPDADLSGPARIFLEITRQYFKHRPPEP